MLIDLLMKAQVFVCAFNPMKPGMLATGYALHMFQHRLALWMSTIFSGQRMLLSTYGICRTHLLNPLVLLNSLGLP